MASRTLVMGGFASAALLAAMLPGVASAASACTYTFPEEGGRYEGTVLEGDVLCGGPGRDSVERMEGGVFRGNGGRDDVKGLIGGTFRGGDAWDKVRRMIAGTFTGGRGRDQVDMMHGGTFMGRRGADSVWEQTGGSYVGHRGHDRILEGMWAGTFDGGPWGRRGRDEHLEHGPAHPPGHHRSGQLRGERMGVGRRHRQLGPLDPQAHDRRRQRGDRHADGPIRWRRDHEHRPYEAGGLEGHGQPVRRQRRRDLQPAWQGDGHPFGHRSQHGSANGGGIESHRRLIVTDSTVSGNGTGGFGGGILAGGRTSAEEEGTS